MNRLTSDQWFDVADLLEQLAQLGESEFQSHDDKAREVVARWIRRLEPGAADNAIRARAREAKG